MISNIWLEWFVIRDSGVIGIWYYLNIWLEKVEFIYGGLGGSV